MASPRNPLVTGRLHGHPKFRKVTILVARAAATADRIGDALVGQLADLVEPACRVSALAIGAVMFLTTDALQTLGASTTARPSTLAEHLRQRELSSRVVSRMVFRIVDEEPADTLARQTGLLLAELRLALNQGRLPVSVTSLWGTVRLIDYLRGALAVTVELAHRCAVAPTRAAQGEVVRALAFALTERRPGSSVELRIPPFAAVQLGALADAAVHTRGTPPNVVETDPATFLAMAYGRLGFADALSEGKLVASGAHAEEIADLFPVVTVTWSSDLGSEPHVGSEPH